MCCIDKPLPALVVLWKRPWYFLIAPRDYQETRRLLQQWGVSCPMLRQSLLGLCDPRDADFWELNRNGTLMASRIWDFRWDLWCSLLILDRGGGEINDRWDCSSWLLWLSIPSDSRDGTCNVCRLNSQQSPSHHVQPFHRNNRWDFESTVVESFGSNHYLELLSSQLQLVSVLVDFVRCPRLQLLLS